MNKEIAKKWVEALRSGEYEQGRRALRSGDSKYCCLGVLCKIVEKEVDGRWLPVYNENGDYGFSTPENTWAGMPGSDVDTFVNGKGGDDYIYNYAYNGRETDLASLNDDGVTFDEIATLIEERYLS